MGRINRILTGAVLSLLIAGTASAQDMVTVSGTVSDESGATIPGAGVVLKGTTTGTATDIDGNYSITIPEKSVLVVSSLGYISTEVNVGTRAKVNVVLSEDINSLDEVVVVGYGTQRKGDLTGAISSLRGESMPSVATTTLGQALKGQIAGMSFEQSSAQPGARVQLQIRGSATDAEPLVVIDGIPVRTMWEIDQELDYGKGDKESVLDNINPEDVQDIQVLKDASATSIYGANAAGGVILITTKKGRAGRTNVSFKSSVTLQWIAKEPEVFSAKEYMRQVNRYQLQQYVYDQEYYPWGNRPLPEYSALVSEFEAAHASDPNKGWFFDPDAIDSFIGGTDWYDYITRLGNIQNYDLSVSGGTEKTTFRVALGYMANEGIAKNSSYDRASGRINLDHKFNSWLSAGINASYTFLKSGDIALSGSSGTTTLFSAARTFDPTVTPYELDGSFSSQSYDSSNAGIGPLSVMDVKMNTKKDNLLTSAYIDIHPVEGLSILGTFGYDRKFAMTGSYFSSTTRQGREYEGVARVDRNELSNYYINIRATYNKVIADAHTFTVMGGWEYQTSGSESLAGWNTGFPYDGVLWNNLELGTNSKPRVYSSAESSQTASFMARLNYSYKGRYLLTANWRLDGSSNFAPNRQWGNFGGVSAAWNMAEEPWLKNVSWINSLKIRAGWGVTGNAGSLTGTRTYYSPGYDYSFNNNEESGVRLAVLGNPDLTWESQHDINIGVDFAFFNNRLGGTVDVYERTIKDRIGKKNLMSYQEVTTMHYNTKRIDKTRGVDFSLYAVPVNTRDFNWSSQFTLTFYRDYTIVRDPADVLDINDYPSYEWGHQWYHLTDGLLQPGEVNPGQLPTDRRAGQVKVLDVNGYLRDEYGQKIYGSDGRPLYSGSPDGIIDAADLVDHGNNTPIPFSWNNTFRYRNFDLEIGIYGKLHRWASNDFVNADPESMLQGKNTIVYVADQYSFDNLDAKYPSYQYWQHDGVGYGDYFREPAWFIRLDNISLGYTLTRDVLKVLQSIRFYLSFRNIAVITPWHGPDPEYNVYTYPSSTSATFGIDINF